MDFRKALLSIPDREALPVYWAAVSLAARWCLISHEDAPDTSEALLEYIEAMAEDLLDRKGSLHSRHALDVAAACIWRAIPGERRAALASVLFEHACETWEE